MAYGLGHSGSWAGRVNMGQTKRDVARLVRPILEVELASRVTLGGLILHRRMNGLGLGWQGRLVPEVLGTGLEVKMFRGVGGIEQATEEAALSLPFCPDPREPRCPKVRDLKERPLTKMVRLRPRRAVAQGKYYMVKQVLEGEENTMNCANKKASLVLFCRNHIPTFSTK